MSAGVIERWESAVPRADASAGESASTIDPSAALCGPPEKPLVPNEGKAGDEETSRRGEGRWRAEELGSSSPSPRPRSSSPPPRSAVPASPFSPGGEVLTTSVAPRCTSASTSERASASGSTSEGTSTSASRSTSTSASTSTSTSESASVSTSVGASTSGAAPTSGAVSPPPPRVSAPPPARGRGPGGGPRGADDRELDHEHAALGPIGLLLRDPAEVARRCLDEEGLRGLTLAALGALALGAAVFGGVVGSFRGGEQILYGAVKVPLTMIAALVVCVPAFHAIAASLGRAWPLRTVIALTVTAAGRAALVLLAFAPVLWLAYDLGLGYHSAALAATGAYATAGLAALGVLLRGLGDGKHRLTTTVAFVAVFLAAAGQTGWMLRPYLVRPQTEDVPFVRAREGGFADAIFVSARSAAGIYERAAESSEQQQRGAPSEDAWREPARDDLYSAPGGY